MSNDVNTLRTALFSALQGLRDGTINLDNARGINEIAKTIVDSARVEVEFVRAAGLDGAHSVFLGSAIETDPPANTGVRKHRIGR